MRDRLRLGSGVFSLAAVGIAVHLGVFRGDRGGDGAGAGGGRESRVGRVEAVRGPGLRRDGAFVDGGSCPAGPEDASLHVLPLHPVAGESIRVVVVARERLDGVGVEVSGWAAEPRLVDAWGPGPFAWEFSAGPLAAGDHRAVFRSRAGRHACVEVRVAPPGAVVDRAAAGSGAWRVERSWDAAMEDLYSVWVARLFRVPDGFRGGWHRLSVVLRNPERNLLHDALGFAEDDPEVARSEGVPLVRARADCGDMPYALRAYFSWKFGLPFRFQRCNRRNPLVGAECYEDRTNLTARFDGIVDRVERFNRFIESDVATSVHSATPRTLPDDSDSDFYPVAFSREWLRPGTVFVYPYGHVLVISDWRDESDGGVTLVAVDGHTDGTVTFKRFSRRNFPYLPGLRTAGFKAFRPVLFDGERIRPLDNSELAASAAPAPFSDDQYRFRRSDDFYETIRMMEPASDS